MELTVKDFEKYIETIAPKYMKEDWDNVGLMIGNANSKISNVLVTLDLNIKSIEMAKKNNCNLIFVHHPLIFKKIGSVVNDNLQGEKIIELIKNDINLYCAHTNLDSCRGGLNEIFSECLDMDEKNIFHEKDNYGIGISGKLKKIVTAKEIMERIKCKYKINNIRYIGDINKKIGTVLMINGSGSSYIKEELKNKIDMIVTGDVTYHFAIEAEESGIFILDAGHFEIENELFRIFSKRFYDNLKLKSFSGKFIYDNITKTPYKYM